MFHTLIGVIILLTSNLLADTPPEYIPLFRSPNHLLYSASFIADINNDGLNDIIAGTIAGEKNPPTLIAFINIGDGKFQYRDDIFPLQYARERGTTTAIIAKDFDNDGDNEIISVTVKEDSDGNYINSKIQYFKRNSRGLKFHEKENFIQPNFFEGWPHWIRVADMDNDHLQDLILTIDGCTSPKGCYGGSILLNHQEKGFIQAPIHIKDNLGSYTSDVLWYDHAQNLNLTRDGPKRIRVDTLDAIIGDFNQNGKNDIYSPGSVSTWATFLNRSKPGELKFDIIFNGGEKKECNSFRGCLSYFKALFKKVTRGDFFPCHFRANTRTCGHFSLFSLKLFNPFKSPYIHKDGIAVDLNGDRYPDLLTSLSVSTSLHDQPVYSLINDKKGGFREVYSQPFNVNNARQWVKVDLDGDGNNDVFIADHGPDQVPFTGWENHYLINTGTPLLKRQEGRKKEVAFTHGASAGYFSNKEGGRQYLFLNEYYPRYKNRQIISAAALLKN